MFVKRLDLTNFRCYEGLSLRPEAGPVIVTGRNAQGKTTLLEALFIAATTRSPTAGAERELLRWGAGADDGLLYGQIHVEVCTRSGEERTIDVIYSLDQGDVEAPPDDRRVTKTLRLNDAPKRGVDLLGNLRVVLFAPQDLALVDGPPAARRRYLDVLLCQTDRHYCRALSRFNKVVTQRNHLLKGLRERGRGADPTAELAYWDTELISHGAEIVAKRMEACEAVAQIAAEIHDELTGARSEFGLVYESTVPEPAEPSGVGSVADAYQAALTEVRREEIARGVTTIGPHRDDIGFELDGMSVRTYGSRGQQRSVALATKLAEARWMAERSDEEPVVLLDDVLSELDKDRRGFLLERLGTDRQTWLTTTDLELVSGAFRQHAQVLAVSRGRVKAFDHALG